MSLPSSVRQSSLTFHNLYFFSTTTKQNSIKLHRKQDLNILYQVYSISGWSNNRNCRPGLRLTDKFSTTSLQPLNRNQRNLVRSKISISPTKLKFFVSIGKPRWSLLPLIGWDIFDFFSKTADRCRTKWSL